MPAHLKRTVVTMKLLKRIADFLEYLNEIIGSWISWLTIAMVVLTFTVVLLRYVFNIGWIGMQESISYLHAFVFMLGAAYTFKHDAHVRVDIFYLKLTSRRQAIIDLFGNLFMLTPMCLFIFFSSLDYVSVSWRISESSQETGGLPYVYLLKTVIPIMSVLLLFQAIAGSLQNLISIVENKSISHTHEAGL